MASGRFAGWIWTHSNSGPERELRCSMNSRYDLRSVQLFQLHEQTRTELSELDYGTSIRRQVLIPLCLAPESIRRRMEEDIPSGLRGDFIVRPRVKNEAVPFRSPLGRRSMKYRHLLLTRVALITLGAGPAFACECAGNRPACQEFWEASAVFVGTVINSRTVTVKEGTYP